MPNAVKQILTGVTFTDTTLPKLPDVDPLESSGSLLLLEPGHPYNPFVGVPASGASLPNLLAGKAVGMIPSGTSATLACTMDVGSTLSGRGLLERTTKNGLHIMLGQASSSGWDLNTYAQILEPLLIGQYLAANPAHSYFVSLWHRYTRLPSTPAGNFTVAQLPAAANPQAFFGRPSSAAGNSGATEYPTGTPQIAQRRTTTLGAAAPIALGHLLQNVGLTKSDAFTSTQGFAYRTGTKANTSSADYAKHPSSVFYRYYLEDLTVSGRSYATVDALDYAEWQAACVNVGGRYYNDTNSNPSSAMP